MYTPMSGKLELELAKLILPLQLERAETVVQHLDRREIIRVLAREQSGAERVLFVKRIFKSRLKDGVASLILRGEVCSKSRMEFENYQTLRRAGIDTAEPLAYGEEMVGVWERGSVIVTGAAAGVDLDKFLSTTPAGAVRNGVIDALGPWVRAMHDSGIAFPDLFSRHVYVNLAADGAIAFSLIDVARLDRRPNPVSMRMRARDLAALNVSISLDMLTWRERLRFLNAYTGVAGEESRNGRLEFIRLVSERSAYLLHRRKFAGFWGEARAAQRRYAKGHRATDKTPPSQRVSGRHGRLCVALPEASIGEAFRIIAAALIWVLLACAWVTSGLKWGGIEASVPRAAGGLTTIGMVGSHAFVMSADGPLDAERARRLSVRKFGFRSVSLSNSGTVSSPGTASHPGTLAKAGRQGIAWRFNVSAWLLHAMCAAGLALACKPVVERAVRERHGLCGHCGADRRGLKPLAHCPACKTAPGPRRVRQSSGELARIPIRAFEDLVLSNIAPRSAFDWRGPLKKIFAKPVAPLGWIRMASIVVGLDAAIIAVCAVVGVVLYSDSGRLFGEGQLGTFASSGVLFTAGWVALGVGRRLGGAPVAWFWKSFAVLLVLTGLDDLLQFHESLDRPILRFFGTEANRIGILRLNEVLTLGYVFPALWLGWRYRHRLVEATLATQIMLLALLAFGIHLLMDYAAVAEAVEESVKLTAGFLILLSVLTVRRDKVLIDDWSGPVKGERPVLR